MSNRFYQGIRDNQGIPEVYVLDSTTRRTLKQQMVLYSDLHFDWGFDRGQEPKDLAIALLADALEGGDDPNVDALYQRLVEETISHLPAQGWQISQQDLVRWVFGKIDRLPVHPLPLDALGGGVPSYFN
ncbi:MAG: DUF6166 domain-containing protein [Actinomycetota bacterium]